MVHCEIQLMNFLREIYNEQRRRGLLTNEVVEYEKIKRVF